MPRAAPRWRRPPGDLRGHPRRGPEALSTTVSLHVVVVSGLSGSGKSTAIHVLEDLGFYCIDNLPVVLVPRFVELCQGVGEGLSRVALGIDLRERAFFSGLVGVIDELRSQGHRVDVLFLDATDDVLVRRFSESRRPHPLAESGPASEGIRRERERLTTLRESADRVVDTTQLTVHELREILSREYRDPVDADSFRVFVVSFGFKHGIAVDADTVFDVRCLPNPFFVEEHRNATGLDEAVSRFLWGFPEAEELFSAIERFLSLSIPLYRREGKRYFTVALGCTGGRHRSVAVAERLADQLSKQGLTVQTRHRDLDRSVA